MVKAVSSWCKRFLGIDGDAVKLAGRLADDKSVNEPLPLLA